MTKRCIVLIVLLAWGGSAVHAESLLASEAKFFSACPQREPIRLHHSANPWDLHEMFYTLTGMLELEVVRVADWLVDSLWLGRDIAPGRRLVQLIHSGYRRLPRTIVTQRVGELIGGLQLAEISFGDAAGTYSAATGGLSGPGRGLLVRVDNLIDWTQHVMGDVNRLLGRPLGRRGGLVRWFTPGHVIDGVQWVAAKTVNMVAVQAVRIIDRGLQGVEIAGEILVNLGGRRPHHQRVVFLRLPRAVYRVYEPWVLEHRANLVVGSTSRFASSTHAVLAHGWRPGAPTDGRMLMPIGIDGAAVIIMTDARIVSRAPEPLKAYVIPAAWVLEGLVADVDKP